MSKLLAMDAIRVAAKDLNFEYDAESSDEGAANSDYFLGWADYLWGGHSPKEYSSPHYTMGYEDSESHYEGVDLHTLLDDLK
jgi:hypothetical protein